MTTYRHVDTGETFEADNDSAIARFEESKAWERVGEKPAEKPADKPVKKAAKKTAKKASSS